MYPRSFLCQEAQIKQRTPFKKELCGIGEEAIWESRFTSFFSKTTEEKSKYQGKKFFRNKFPSKNPLSLF